MPSLPVKYRPKRFASVVGQEVPCRMLESQVMQRDFRPVYLFTGNAGTGKTTVARIFAEAITGSPDEIMEIDAASNNGVDSILVLREHAQMRPMYGDYKVYIIDECFHKDTSVTTLSGDKKISEIVVGDTVVNAFGEARVKSVFKNVVPVERLCLVMISGKRVLTTIDHLFYTDIGWVKAKDLEGRRVYVQSNMSDMSEPVYKQKTYNENLQHRVQKQAGWKEQSASRGSIVHGLQKDVSVSTVVQSKDMQQEMQEHSNRSFSEERGFTMLQDMRGVLCHFSQVHTENLWQQDLCENDIGSNRKRKRKKADKTGQACMRDMSGCVSVQGVGNQKNLFYCMPVSSNQSLSTWQGCIRVGEEADERKEPYHGSLGCTKDTEHKDTKRYQQVQDQGGEWLLYETSNDVEGSIGGRLEARVSSEDGLSKEVASLPSSVQSRFRSYREENSYRDRWDHPSIEEGAIVRQKENGLFTEFRVDSIEVYERGDINGHFERYFSREELSLGLVAMYDLEIEGHPSYLVDGLLVHNCHSLSTSSFTALLKLLEEPPEYAIFILCTTDVQKLPMTIISRAARYKFTRLRIDELVDRLDLIAQKEGRVVEVGLLHALAKRADGSMREGISLLDACLSYVKTDPVTLVDVEGVLGVGDKEIHKKLMRAILSLDVHDVTSALEDVYRYGDNWGSFLGDWVNFLLGIREMQLIDRKLFGEEFDGEEFLSVDGSRIVALIDQSMDALSKVRFDPFPRYRVEALFLGFSQVHHA